MADAKAFTSTPDSVSGNVIDVVTVTNANSDIVDRQTVVIGDPSTAARVAITASGMQVQTGPITAAASVTQVTSPWIISGSVSLATAAATIGQVVLATGGAVVGALATGTATVGQVALVTGAAVIGALAANQSVTGTVINATGTATLGQIVLATGAAVIGVLGTGSATLGQVALVTGAAVIGALTANQSVTGAVNITSMGGIAVTAVTNNVQALQAVPVQEYKDAGRTYLTFQLTSFVAVVTEAMVTMQINSAETLSSGTTYTVTAGKRLRLQSMFLGGHVAATTANFVRLILHSGATAATTTVASVLAVETGNDSAAAANARLEPIFLEIPDGLEIAAGKQIGFSQTAAVTSARIDMTLIGFEY